MYKCRCVEYHTKYLNNNFHLKVIFKYADTNDNVAYIQIADKREQFYCNDYHECYVNICKFMQDFAKELLEDLEQKDRYINEYIDTVRNELDL